MPNTQFPSPVAAPNAIRLLVTIALFTIPGSGQDPLLLEGRVVDLDGKPIQGCRVSSNHPTRPSSARSDADGRYALTSIERSTLVLRFEAPGHCSVAYQHWIRATPEMKALSTVPTIALSPAVTVAGRIRDPDGQPIPGTTVTGRDLAPSELRLSETVRSNDEGIFLLRSVPDSPLELSIEANGYSPVRLLPIDRSSPLDVTLDPAVSCSGRLLDAQGLPVTGRVSASYEDGGGTSTQTGDGGAFQLMIKPGIRYRVTYYDPTTRTAIRSEILEGSASGLELRMPDERRDPHLELTVVNAGTGEPVAEFNAYVNFGWDQMDWGSAYAFASRNPRLGREGRLLMPVDVSWQEGHGVAIVRATGRAEVFSRLERPVEGEQLSRVRIEMLPERSVSGIVVDAEGNPVEGARVWPFVSETRISSYSPIPADVAVETNSEGRFRIGGLAAIGYALNVHHGSFPTVAPIEITLIEGDLKDVTLTLGGAAQSQVRLRWDNAPLQEGWWIDLVEDPKRGANRLPRWGSGRSRIRTGVEWGRPLDLKYVPSSAYYVGLHRLTRGRLAQELVVSLGTFRLDGLTERTIDLGQINTGRIKGRVSAGSQVGVDRLVVWARGEASGRTDAAALLDRDGSFILETLVGNYAVEVVDILTGFPVGRTDDVRVAAGESVDCELEVEAGVLDVRVRLPEGATRTAMRSLLLELPPVIGRGRARISQVRLADLRGDLRFVLPPGDLRIGFQRAKGVLGSSGGSRFVTVGMVRVTVVSGRIDSVILQEPSRLSTETLANEDNR